MSQSFDDIYNDYLNSNKSVDDVDITKKSFYEVYEEFEPDNPTSIYMDNKIKDFINHVIQNKDWEFLFYLFESEQDLGYDLFLASVIQKQVENLGFVQEWYEFIADFYKKSKNIKKQYIIIYVRDTNNEELFNTLFSDSDIDQMVKNKTEEYIFITRLLKKMPTIIEIFKKHEEYHKELKSKNKSKNNNFLPFETITRDLKMDTTTKYALLGKKLFEKCKTSQATNEELIERLSQLRRWNQKKIEWEDSFEHSEDDNEYLNNLLQPIDLNIPFDTPATFSEVEHFANVCGLTRDTISIEDLFVYDWREKSIVYIDPKTNLQYIKIPKEGIIYHGMDIKYPFDMSRVPKYFGTLTTAYPYGFVSLKNARSAEQGKVIAFRLKRDILVLDISVIENWKILIPTESSAPKEVLIAAEECFNYKPNSDDILSRTSSTECDNIIYQYLLSLPQTSIADAAGARSQGRMTDEIVFTDSSKLELAGYELPYEIVMVNDLTSDNGVDCAFVIEARSTVDDRNFRLVTTLSEKDFRLHKYQFAPEAGETTFDNITPEQIKKMRQQCMQRALGNFEITMIEDFNEDEEF